MTNHIEQLFLDAYRVLEQKQPPPFVPWAKDNFKLSKGATQGETEDFNPEPWQIGIMHCMANLDIVKFWLVKGAQIGWSQMLKAFIAYELAARGRGTALWMPREADKARYRSVQVKTLLEDCQALADCMLGEPGKKSETNKTDLIMFELATFFLSSAQTPANFRDINCATAAIDEFSAIPRYVGKEGSPDSNALARTDSAEDPALRIGSTPLTKDDCQITEAVEDVYHQLHREVPCMRCGWLQELRFGGKKTKYGLRYEKIYYENSNFIDKKATAETTRYQCEKCHGYFTHQEYCKADHDGVWLGDALGLDDDSGEFFDRETGEWLEAPYEVSMRASQFLSHRKEWGRQITAWLDADAKLKERNDSSGIIQFVQESEGRCYETAASQDEVEWKVIQARCSEDYLELYGALCPQQVQYITAHIDVHPQFVVMEVRGWGYGFESWSLDYYHETGNPLVKGVEELEKNEVLTLMMDRCQKTYYRPDQSGMEILVCGVDAGWQKDIALSMQKFDRHFYIPMLGQRKYKRPICTPPSKNPDRDGMYPLWVGTDTAKDHVYASFRMELPGPGFIHYPDRDAMTPEKIREAQAALNMSWNSEGFYEYDDTFFKGACSEKIITKWSNGEPTEIYVKRSSSIRNEPLDCATNNLALMRFLVVKRGATLIPYVPQPVGPVSANGSGNAMQRSAVGITSGGLSPRELYERNQRG